MIVNPSRSVLIATTVVLAVGALFFSQSASAITPEALQHFQRAQLLEAQNNLPAAEQEYRTTMALDPYDSQTYIKLGYLQERRNHPDEALQLYSQALALNPKDTMLHLSLAQLYENKGQIDQALDHYQRLLATNPEYPYAYLAIARLEKARQHPAESIQAYQAFLKIYPQHYDAQRELASVQLSQNQYAQAASTYQTLKGQHQDKFKDDLSYGIALNNSNRPAEALAVFQTIQTPSVTLYEQMGICQEKLSHLPEAYDSYQRALLMAPREKSELYLKLADIATSLNQKDKTLLNLQAYLQQHPENIKVAKSLADAYMDQQNYPQAIALYEQALPKISAKDKDVRTNILRQLGYAYQVQGNLVKAESTYETALASEDDYQTRLNLAIIYHQQKKYAQAADLYRKLLVDDPRSESVRKDLGQVLLALGDEAYQGKEYTQALKNYQDAYLLGSVPETQILLGLANAQYALKNYPIAYSSYERLLELDPNNVTARINKAQLDVDQKNYALALDNLNALSAQHPELPAVNNLLAYAYAGTGNYSSAITYFKKALASQPNDVSLLMGYGNAWRQVGDVDKAQQAYEQARAIAPDRAIVQYNLASIYTLKGNLDASIASYQKALALNPNFYESYYGLGTAYEKKKLPKQALEVYEKYVTLSAPGAAYMGLAKQRVTYLKKGLSGGAILKSPSEIAKTAPKSSLTKPTPTIADKKPAVTTPVVKNAVKVTSPPANTTPTKPVIKKAVKITKPPKVSSGVTSAPPLSVPRKPISSNSRARVVVPQ